jgi:hypothetical protein
MMIRSTILFVVACAGCHPHLAKDFGWASRAAFSAQYTNLQGTPPAGPDGQDAAGAMQRARMFGMPDEQQQQQNFITPINLGAKQ